MSKLAIITPIHKPILNELEVIRLTLTLKFNPQYNHFFVTPETMKTDQLKFLFPKSNFKFFNNNYFRSKQTYNDLMLELDFYESFIDYEYMLIHQTDAFLIKDITSVLKQNFVYLGASWNPEFIVTNLLGRLYINRKISRIIPSTKLVSGNGGLSLRKTSTILEVLNYFKLKNLFAPQIFQQRKIAEDILLVFMLHVYGIAPIPKSVADLYFVESMKLSFSGATNKFGFHALEKFQPELEVALINNYYHSK